MEDFKFYGSATVGTKGQVVIPAEAREELKLKEGDKVIIVKAPKAQGVMVLKADIFKQALGQLQSSLGLLAESVKKDSE